MTDERKTGGVSKSTGPLIGALILFAAWIPADQADAEEPPGIRFHEETGVFELGPFPGEFAEGLDPDFRFGKLFSLRVVAEDPDRPGMVGKHSWTNAGFLRFEPRFPPVPGLSYEARFLPGALPESLSAPDWRPKTKVFAVPKLKNGPAAKVTGIYPSSDRLPENLLKFYLHFSRPMSRGEAYENIRLLDDEGEIIPLPFLELGEELWDAEQRRFTLFFDPGRVKRGLKPHLDEGRPLRSGRRYTLVVKTSWKDARRNELARTWRKTFDVVAPDYAQPDPKTWKLTLPDPATRDPLNVSLGESLDRALLDRALWIEEADGQRVPGLVTVGGGETSWQWTPDSPWKKGRYSLVVDPVLEDLAGNSIGRPFEERETDSEQFGVVPLARPARRVFKIGVGN